MKNKRLARIVMISIIAALSVGCGISVNQLHTLQSKAQVSADTASALQSENNALRTQVEASSPSAVSSSVVSKVTASSSASSQEPVSAVSKTQTDNGANAQVALSSVLQNYYALTERTTPNQQIASVSAWLTDKEKKALTADAQSGNGDTSTTGTSSVGDYHMQSKCTVNLVYSHSVNATTENVLAVCTLTTTINGSSSNSTLLVSAQVVQQNGKWLVDSMKVAQPQNVSAQNLE